MKFAPSLNNLWLRLFPKTESFFLFHSLAPSLFFVLSSKHSVGCEIFPVFAWPVFADPWEQVEDLGSTLVWGSEVLLLPLVACPVKRRLIGCRKRGPIGLRGCDAAAKSFICPAKRLSINEVVKGGNICGRGEGKVFTGSLWEIVCFGWVPFFYLLNSRGDQYTEVKMKFIIGIGG